MSGFTHESARSTSVEWYTPPEIFEALQLQFDLDPCSPGRGRSFVPAELHYTEADDGLAAPWLGTVFVNPPYGSETQAWVRRLADHGDGVGLVFARTDVRWFHEQAVRADLICFVNSRIRFYDGNLTDRGGSPGAGSMLLAFGDLSARAVLLSGLGACFKLVSPTPPRR